MGISLDSKTKTWVAYHSKRHPTTKIPKNLKRIGIKSKVEAQRVFNSLVIKLDKAFRTQIQPTWNQFLDEYFIHLQTADITNTTRYNREKLLRYHTQEAWGSKHIDEITHEIIHNMLKTRLKDNKESSRKCFIKYVRGVFDYAVDRQLVSRNPTPRLKFKISSKIKAVLNQEQIETLLRKTQEQNWPWYPHYSVAVFTGLRNGELFALKWENIYLEKRQILVNCSWSNKDGFKSTKSGHDRLVEIPLPLMPLLRELKLKSAESDFVLPRLGRWDRGEQAYDLRMFLKANDLPVVNFHNLRASWATMLLNKGTEQAKVMIMGGWSDLKTMMIYVRKAGIDIRGSTSALDDISTHGLKQAEVINIRSL